MQRLLIVDYLKGFSIFTISLMHLLMKPIHSGILLNGILFGGAGVHVFILCSGFGLYLSYCKKPLKFIDFLKRRFSKVWIPYAIAVIFWGIWLQMTAGNFPIKEVTSHLLLYKMFSTELDTSLCYPYWFISTIIQFYLFWPILVKIFKMKWGGCAMLIISLSWSTIVGGIGLEEERPWGSFFLQYLWEFGLGMWIAERIHEGKSKMVDVRKMKWLWLLLGAVGGMGLSAIMAWNGGWLKLYNDIPSLLGYLSVALLIYKFDIRWFNRFFEWANGFSYELYLIHSLVFAVIAYSLKGNVPLYLEILLCFIVAYIAGYCYSFLLKIIRIK